MPFTSIIPLSDHQARASNKEELGILAVKRTVKKSRKAGQVGGGRGGQSLLSA